VAPCRGHDEAGLNFYSNAPGSGGNITWTATLPRDGGPTRNQSDLYSSVWFGLPVTAPSAWMGQCFLEIQLYPDSSWYVHTPSHPSATDNGQWVGQAVAWQIDLATGHEDTCFSEPLYRNGLSGPDYLNMSQGDHLRIQMVGWTGSPYGENITVTDLTNGNASTVRLFNATGGYPIDPAYSSSAFENSLAWTPGGALPAVMGFELGHAGNPTIPSNSSFQGCSPGVPPSIPLNPAVPCPSYDPASWANDTAQPWQIGIPTFTTDSGISTPSQVAFSQNFGGSLAVTTLSNGTCSSRIGSAFCSYPWFSYSCPAVGFAFGATDFPGVTTDFGQGLEYSPSPVTSALGLAYYPANNFTIPTCGRPNFTLGVGLTGIAGGAVHFLSQVVAPGPAQTSSFGSLAPGSYSVHALVPPGSAFGGWSVSGGAQIADPNDPWSTLLLQDNGTLTAAFASTVPRTTVWFNGTGATGAVAVSPSTADLNRTPLATVASGASIALLAGLYTVEAYPPSGWTFSGWSLGSAGGRVASAVNPVTWLSVTGGTSQLVVTAHYAPSVEGATIIVKGIGNGTLTFNGGAVPYFPANRSSFGVFLVPVGTYSIGGAPAPGWSFLGWSAGPSGVETDFGLVANITLENGTTTLVASLGAKITFLVTPATDGLVSLSGRTPVANGTSLVQPLGGYFLNAIPYGGFTFKRWSVSDPAAAWVFRATASQSRMQLNASVTITATYMVRSAVNLTFHVAPVGWGTIQFNLISPYSDGGFNSTLTNGTYLLTALAGSKYRFTGWAAAGAVSIVGNQVTVRGPGGVVTAHFVLRLYSVTFVATSSSPIVATINGLPTVNGQTVHLPRGTFNISASAGVNTTFVGWASSLPVSQPPPPPASAAKLTVQASGTLTALTVPYVVSPIWASRTVLDLGSSVQLRASANGSGPFAFGWAGLPSGCISPNAPTLTCIATVVGVLSIRVSVTGPAGVPVVSPTLSLRVVPSPSVTQFNASPSQFDLGLSTSLLLAVADGVGPFSYQYLGLPAGCGSSNSTLITCTPSAAGRSIVEAQATDALGESAYANVTVDVSVAPSITAFVATPSTVTQGVVTVLTVTVSGGSGPFSFVYGGLPTGCTSASTATLTCVPGASGAFAINVTATDLDNLTTQSSLVLNVNPLPTVTSFVASPSTVSFGSNTHFTVVWAGGTAPFSFAYSSLPTGCTTANLSSLGCTPAQPGKFTVRVTVTDRFGVSATATTDLTVTPSGGSAGPFPGWSSFGGIPWWLWLAIVVLAAVLLIGIVIRMRRRSPPPTTPDPSKLPPREYVPPPEDVGPWTEGGSPPGDSPAPSPPD
jgi:Divergent InlB B-repeat domain